MVYHERKFFPNPEFQILMKVVIVFIFPMLF